MPAAGTVATVVDAVTGAVALTFSATAAGCGRNVFDAKMMSANKPTAHTNMPMATFGLIMSTSEKILVRHKPILYRTSWIYFIKELTAYGKRPMSRISLPEVDIVPVTTAEVP